MANEFAAFCPRFHRAVELIGKRWSGAIVRMLLDGPKRYGQIAETIPDLSDRMLAERLKELESEGIVVRRVVPETPVRVEYSLSEKGRDLQDAILALAGWAERWIPAAEATAEEESAASRPVAPVRNAPRPAPARRSRGR